MQPFLECEKEENILPSVRPEEPEKALAFEGVSKGFKRLQILEKLTELKDEKTVFISSTGFTSRELYEVRDDEQNFYMVGSMGCASSIGLGLSLVQQNKEIVVIEGDGSLLMRLSSLQTNAFYSLGNMLHIVLDNNAHESTGGQKTVSENVDFVNLALDSGYKKSVYIHDLDELEKEYKKWKENKILTFFYIKILQGKKENLGRPKIKPFEVKERLMEWLKKP
ncbi:MAG: thiamine pyrophosphate-dependent enzyme [bacterium]